MLKMKKIISCMLIAVILIAFAVTVKADTKPTVAFKLTTDATSIKKDDEITVNVTLTGISGYSTLVAFSAVHSFNPEDWQCTQIIPISGWEKFAYGQENGLKFNVQKKTGTATGITGGLVCQLKYKALKDNPSTISLVELETSGMINGEVVDIFEGDPGIQPQISLTIAETPVNPDGNRIDGNTTDGNTAGGNTTTENKTTENNTTTEKKNTTNTMNKSKNNTAKNTTSANRNIPATGIEGSNVFFAIIAILVVLGTVAGYFGYKKYSK